jgi:hypothetical protein
MLAVNKYEKTYIETCRRQVDAQLAAYDDMVAARGNESPHKDKRDAAIAAFEQHFLRHMILALDRYFVHRTRALEKKDGNPLNEVRMLCTSITEGHDTLQADSTIKYDPARSVLKLRIGDEIRLSVDGFRKLSRAFFDDLHEKFG